MSDERIPLRGSAFSCFRAIAVRGKGKDAGFVPIKGEEEGVFSPF